MIFCRCPSCGKDRVQLMACKHCGYSYLEQKKKNRKVSHKNKILKGPSGKLPEFGKGQKNDIFDTGRVVSGGGFGVGKKK